jgi:bifunctional DNA-binding transcriptional regulator/antitoxin component of YhaV-PrlF toxin-antitoxin module
MRITSKGQVTIPLEHQSVVGQFFMAMAEYVRQHDAGGIWLAPIDVVLDRQQPLVVASIVI